jgi:gas vesicle protein
MSQQDNFAGGFVAGAVFGSIIGGILGVVLTSKRLNNELPSEEPFLNPNLPESKTSKAKKRQLKASTEQSIEAARRGLEDKIAQLNEAIDDVRHQLSNVNGNALEETSPRYAPGDSSRSLPKEP